MSNPFKFKQFEVHQDRCAMKIGTDAVILGAWTDISPEAQTILDIGAGTGILSLMMAQRSNAESIDAIEINEDSFEQCVDNFEISPWSDRLYCYHASFQEYYSEIDDKYNLIICNPPFFEASSSSSDNPTPREKARLNQNLPLDELIHGVSLLLSQKGTFSIILPYSSEDQVIDEASKVKLHPFKILSIKGTPTSKIKRSCIQFSFVKSQTKVSELIIETERHKYTGDYINLTRDFYLRM